VRLIADFIEALREAGLPISPAESLDALNAIHLIGLERRETAKMVLALTLVKRQEDKGVFDTLFGLYFAGLKRPNESNAKQGNDQKPTNETNHPQDEQAHLKWAQRSDGFSGAQASASSALGQALSQQEDMGLAITQAASAENLSSIVLFTQKNQFVYKIMKRLGDEELREELKGQKQTQTLEQSTLFSELEKRRAQLFEQVTDYVEQQYLTFAKQKGLRLCDQHMQQMKLNQLEQADYQRMQRLIQKAARKLAAQHSHRRLTRKRGVLDVRKTIAANAAFDGALFHTRWKATRVERPKIVVICDVSGSVSRVARFLLLFLYSLQDVIPKVRSFVFASQMIEVTELLQQQQIESALETIMQRWGGMSTDYGKALAGFGSQALTKLDKKTTVIMLGDARNNQGDGRTDIWQKVYRQSKRVLWLNPEQRSSWDTGDSIMSKYSPWCSSVEPCRNLKDIEGIFSRILKYS
jgi:uncharacterized protein with von Willebrand factor type A (vWA) domain